MDYAENYERCMLEKQSAFQRYFIAVMTRRARALGFDSHKVFALKYVVEHYLPHRDDLVVLDCGAWNGWFLSYTGPRIRTRLALDFDRHFGPSLIGQGVPFVLADMEKGALPYAADSIDILAMTSTLEHLSCPEHIATEMSRVLKPGGIVFITVPDIKKYKWDFWNDITHKRPFTDKALRFLFETHGFETVECCSYNHNLFMAGNLFPSGLHRRLMRFRGDALLYVGRTPGGE